MADNNISNRGFASMDEDKRREVASKGGRANGGKNLNQANRSETGRKGAASQSREAKSKGGQASRDRTRI
jgi:general stress protein YciG